MSVLLNDRSPQRLAHSRCDAVSTPQPDGVFGRCRRGGTFVVLARVALSPVDGLGRGRECECEVCECEVSERGETAVAPESSISSACSISPSRLERSPIGFSHRSVTTSSQVRPETTASCIQASSSRRRLIELEVFIGVVDRAKRSLVCEAAAVDVAPPTRQACFSRDMLTARARKPPF
jgi:hypothetical protein